MYHSLFITSPTEGHLGCFQVLVIKKKAAVIICVQVLCGHEFSIPLGKYQGMRLLDSMVRECLIFKKLTNCLPKWLYHFVFPLAMNESSCCMISSVAFGVVSIPDFSHSNRCVVVYHGYFNLHFLRTYDGHHLSVCLLTIYLLW